MSIMVIFASVVLTGFRRQPPEAALEQSAMEVRSAILTARNLALAPQTKYAAPAGGGAPAKYFAAKITKINGSNIVEVIKYDSDGIPSSLSGYSKTLPSKINISDWEVKFEVAASVISFDPPTNSIDITHSDITDRKATISVDRVTGYTDITIQQP